MGSSPTTTAPDLPRAVPGVLGVGRQILDVQLEETFGRVGLVYVLVEFPPSRTRVHGLLHLGSVHAQGRPHYARDVRKGERIDPKRIVAEGYDRLGPAFSTWVAENPAEVRSWFLREVLARLAEGSHVLELGCGPGTAATELSAGRRYTGGVARRDCGHPFRPRFDTAVPAPL